MWWARFLIVWQLVRYSFMSLFPRRWLRRDALFKINLANHTYHVSVARSLSWKLPFNPSSCLCIKTVLGQNCRGLLFWFLLSSQRQKMLWNMSTKSLRNVLSSGSKIFSIILLVLEMYSFYMWYIFGGHPSRGTFVYLEVMLRSRELRSTVDSDLRRSVNAELCAH